MFAQGGLCFFCGEKLPKSEASVEHLIPTSRAGSNSDDNCVACCKAMNALLGSMSLKEKIKVVLNQKGDFKCPNSIGQGKSKSRVLAKAAGGISESTITAIIENLRSRGNARPRKIKTLSSTIRAMPQFKLDDQQVKAIVEYLRVSGQIDISGEQVSYNL